MAGQRGRRSYIKQIVAAAVLAAPALACADIWNNATGDATWVNASNWADGTVPTLNDFVLLPSPAPGGAHTLSLATPASAVTSGSITANDDYTFTNGSLSLNPVSNSGTITVATGKALTIEGSVYRSSGLIKVGGGTLVLSGDNTTSLGGSVSIGGTLSFASDANLGGATGVTFGGTARCTGTFSTSKAFAPGNATGSAIAVTAGNTLTLNAALPANGNELVKSDAGRLTLTQASTRTGSTNVSAGMLRLNNKTAAGTGALSVGNATLELSNVLFSQTVGIGQASTITGLGNSVVSVASSVSAATPTFQTASVTDKLSIDVLSGQTPAAIAIAGPGTVRLNATPYSVGVHVTSGTLQGSSIDSFGSGTSPIQMDAGTTMELNGSFPGVGTRTVNLSDGCTFGALRDFAGSFAIAANAHVSLKDLGGGFAGNLRFTHSTSAITGGVGATIHMAQGGFILPNPTDYAGTWSFDRGQLYAQHADSLGTGSSALILNGGGLSLSALRIARPIQVTAAGGFLSSSAAVSLGAVDGVGNLFMSGVMSAPHIRVGNLTVSNQRLTTTPDGTASGVSTVRSLTIAAGASLDLANNALIDRTTGTGAWNGSAYNGITGMLAKGRNNGAWNGSGIVTSMPDASAGTELTTLAVAAAGDLAIDNFRGISVAPTDTIVAYTYAGDADLTGSIDGDDYFRIDAGFASASTGYASGDFNYDGRINADDYFLIDHNYARQSAAFAGARADLTAVPEPSIAGWLGGCALLGGVRRRRVKLASRRG